MSVRSLADTTDLFDPVQLGPLTLTNRIVMAPLTRSRADDEGNVGELQATYYAQRASAGLIVSEATNISKEAKGYILTPGIFTDSHVKAWRLTTDAVHKKGGHIFLQLWHVGRISHPDLQPGGALPVAPSAVLPQGQAFTKDGFKPLVTPRALETDEIPRIVAEYAHAAKLAKDAGFDGVEIHAANGYLLQQFLADKTNLRTDRYGGSPENRARIVVEVAEAVTKVWGGGERVGIRLSPVTKFGDMGDSNPEPTYLYLIEQLNRLGLVYIHVIEGDTQGDRNPPGAFDPQSLRKAFKGLYIGNNGYDLKLALETRANNLADLICFGRPFISNPDLVERLRVDAPLAEGDRDTYYGGGAKGYTDYPSL